MSDSWPPLDTHAHIDSDIDPTELVALKAVVFAATRSLAEFEKTVARSDPVTVWGVGVHPGVPQAVEAFTPRRFRAAIAKTPIVSEIGLDGRSAVPMARQLHVFDQILEVLGGEPRIVSVHSAGATAEVLDVLEQRPVPGIVLHWWRGTPGQTARAVALGCRFSINETERRRPAVVAHVPGNLVLTETDYPFASAAPGGPGDVAPVEAILADHNHMTQADVRREIWINMAALVADTATIELFGDRLQRMLSATADR